MKDNLNLNDNKKNVQWFGPGFWHNIQKLKLD
jgi:hypothetical protein